MARALKTAGAIYAVGLMIFALFLWLGGAARTEDGAVAAQTNTQAQAASQAAEEADEKAAKPLFPGLKPEDITAISVQMPDRDFSFSTDSSGRVSVNGRRADQEIYRTLVSQIAALPVDACVAFSTEEATLLMALTICTGGGERTARFYEDDGTREMTRVVTDGGGGPAYGETGGWRVGTLMMTCEGTRIQDARGNEYPAAITAEEHDRP